jgi:putative chitinase
MKRALVGSTTVSALLLGGLATAAPASAAGERWPVSRPGSTGTDVRTVQHLLRHQHYGDRGDSGLEVDGAFGPATTAAVRAFQRDHRLPPDGAVGPAT